MDSTALIAASIQNAAADLGYPVPDAATANHVIGLGLQDALAIAIPQLPASEYGRVAERYRFHFLARDPNTSLFPGTLALLNELAGRGHVLAIATGKSRAGLDRALKASGAEHLIAASRCAGQVAAKPAPDMLLELMETLDVPAASTIMIGDTTHDILMAKSAGVVAVAVTHGAHPRSALEELRPLACIDNTAELSQWLRTNA